MITQQILKEWFDYIDDQLRWKKSPTKNKKYLGRPAGTLFPCGYVYVKVLSRPYRLHRIIWMWHHGVIPKGYDVDHIDRNPLNNCISNLRLLTRSQNNMNSSRTSTRRTSKYKGVSWHPNTNKWRVVTVKNKKQYHAGYFSNEDEAARAYNELVKLIHGDCAYLNEEPE